MADAASKADMLRVTDTIKAAHGQLEILFANAGGGHATQLEELTVGEWDSPRKADILDGLEGLERNLTAVEPPAGAGS